MQEDLLVVISDIRERWARVESTLEAIRDRLSRIDCRLDTKAEQLDQHDRSLSVMEDRCSRNHSALDVRLAEILKHQSQQMSLLTKHQATLDRAEGGWKVITVVATFASLVGAAAYRALELVYHGASHTTLPK